MLAKKDEDGLTNSTSFSNKPLSVDFLNKKESSKQWYKQKLLLIFVNTNKKQTDTW